MRVYPLLATLSLAVSFVAAPMCAAQSLVLPETRNAALRYWLAMNDLKADPAELLTETEGGESRWDESKLGPILDANMEAIGEMQRATKLPDCDWGLEYNRGARASVSLLMRAGVLARLNTLYGMRMMAKGESGEAAEAWLDGVKFAQDLAKGGPVIVELFGRAALLSDFRAITSAAKAGELSAGQKREIADKVRTLTPDVFDWSEALGLEEAAFESVVGEIRTSKNPGATYRELNGEAMPKNFVLPTPESITAFRAVIAEAQAALRTPAADAGPRLNRLQMQIARFGPYFQLAVPSLSKINDARAEVETARESLLAALGSPN
jgi:hypothetical protein